MEKQKNISIKFKKLTISVLLMVFIVAFGFSLVGFNYPGNFAWVLASGSNNNGDFDEDLEEIEIKVLGPVFENGVFYYRIFIEIDDDYHAPTVTFSKDDSLGAWGSLAAQVNLAPGETYSLIITIGSISETIILQGTPGFLINETAVNATVEIEQETEGDSEYGISDYGVSGYDYGDSDYEGDSDSDYGNSDYSDSDYEGDSDSDYGNSDYGDSDYGNSDYED